MRQGVDFVIGASSAEVVSEGSSFVFVCFCKEGVVPPIPAVPIHHALDVSDFRSVLLPALWLVPVISFLEINASETIAKVSPCDVALPLCGCVIPIPSSMGLLGAEVASSSIVFIFFPLELFLVA